MFIAATHNETIKLRRSGIIQRMNIALLWSSEENHLRYYRHFIPTG
jgi:hypothetical protein